MLRCNHRRNKNYPEYRWSNTCCSLQQEIIVYSQQPNKIAINYKENLALMILPTSTCQVKIRMYRILFPTRMNNKKKCQQKAEKDKKKCRNRFLQFGVFFIKINQNILISLRKYKILFTAITNKTRSETNKIKAFIPMKDFFQTNNKTREPNYFKFNLFWI